MNIVRIYDKDGKIVAEHLLRDFIGCGFKTYDEYFSDRMEFLKSLYPGHSHVIVYWEVERY